MGGALSSFNTLFHGVTQLMQAIQYYLEKQGSNIGPEMQPRYSDKKCTKNPMKVDTWKIGEEE